MAPLDLLRSQKNQIFEILQAEELGPFLPRFRWELVRGRVSKNKVPLISITEGKNYYYFEFDYLNDYHYIEFFPSENLLTVDSRAKISWESVRDYVRNWARGLKKEIGSPDLWKEVMLVQSSSLANFPEWVEDSTSFTQQEKDRILNNIETFRLKLPDVLKLNPSQKEALDSHVDYLGESLKRAQTKLDWKNIALSTLINISIALSLGPEQGKQLYNLFKEVVLNVLPLLK